MENSNQNHIDIYDQLIDEDPEKESLISDQIDEETQLFDKIEEKAAEDLTRQKIEKPVVQTGGNVRAQIKRPLSQKIIKNC